MERKQLPVLQNTTARSAADATLGAAVSPAARFWKTIEERSDLQARTGAGDVTERPHGGAMMENTLRDMEDPVARRRFLQVMGASMAMASAAACTNQPTEKIIPYVTQPEGIIPGRPLFFATAMTFNGIGRAVLAESHVGRPTKLEGNPDHPTSRGATDAFTQAEMLQMYDPERSQALTHFGEQVQWPAFVAAMQTTLSAYKAGAGKGLRFLTGHISSPTVAAELAALLKDMPEAKWHVFEPAGSDSARLGAKHAFGMDVALTYDLEKADVVFSLDADFLHVEGNVSDVRGFAARRHPNHPAGMNRLYVVDSTMTATGGSAEHRLPVRHGDVESIARALAAQLGVASVKGAKLPTSVPEAWLKALAADLSAHKGKAVVIPGPTHPAAVHAIANAINAHLGSVGADGVVRPISQPLANPAVDSYASLTELTQDMAAGRVQALIVIGTNPVYTAPRDLGFPEHYAKVGLRVHYGFWLDETAKVSHWHVPATHDLEAWGDVRLVDGSITIQQPLILPLYGGRSLLELAVALSADPTRKAYDVLQNTYKTKWGAGFDAQWRAAVHDGFVAGSAFGVESVSAQSLEALPVAPATTGLEVNFRADASAFDGRYANNAWLQELPRPVSRLVWDNAVLVSPETARSLGVEREDWVTVSVGGQNVVGAVWIQPGQPKDVITVHLGYGRKGVGTVSAEAGFDANLIRSAKSPWARAGATVTKTGEKYWLISTQKHHDVSEYLQQGTKLYQQDVPGMERHLFRTEPASVYAAKPDVFVSYPYEHHDIPSVFPKHEYPNYSWGMTIDLSKCVGCNACVIACQAENNIPTVGKGQVKMQREMHWLRIDRYYEGEEANPSVAYQPVPCMQCENAPCEVMCPVQATSHHEEGLNDMAYNRCVGTRYCANNCPYRVRRFNFFNYQKNDHEQPSMKLLNNPDVTVRFRGIMEKCTYCVQRINAARIDSKREERKIRDGEIMTACQAACPAQAIDFGNMHDPNSAVSKRKLEKRNYTMMAPLNTLPHTTYLAHVSNPNPALKA